MSTPAMIPSLALVTLVGVLAIAIVCYLLFIRKRSNRHPVEESGLAGRTMAPSESDGSGASTPSKNG